MISSSMTYAGYSYEPWEDIEPGENCKVFHDVYAEQDGVRLCVGYMPLSPYSHPSMEVFVKWIDCGRPSRKEINDMLGTSGNASCEDILNYYNRWLDNKIDSHLLGVENEFVFE